MYTDAVYIEIRKLPTKKWEFFSALDFTVIRKYSQQLIINAGKQCAKNRQAFSFLERMSVYFLPRAILKINNNQRGETRQDNHVGRRSERQIE